MNETPWELQDVPEETLDAPLPSDDRMTGVIIALAVPVLSLIFIALGGIL